MFEQRNDIKCLRVSRGQIVALIESINQPMVAISGRALETAKGYIIGIRSASNMFSVVVYLYLQDSKECLVYLQNPPEIALEAFREHELEALGFLESMGFIMDNKQFHNLTPDQQEDLIANTPAFHADLKAFAQAQSILAAPAEEVDLSEYEENVIELEEVAEEVRQVAQSPQVTAEGLSKIVRFLSSF